MAVMFTKCYTVCAIVNAMIGALPLKYRYRRQTAFYKFGVDAK